MPNGILTTANIQQHHRSTAACSSVIADETSTEAHKTRPNQTVAFSAREEAFEDTAASDKHIVESQTWL